MVNPREATGEIEVGVTALEVLNEAEPPPFPLDGRVEVDETLRLRHRYLDLRRPRMAANLVTRAKLVSAMRQAMDTAGFIDVETPTLTRSTPEGARDFLVPSRLTPGTFFALPQSPQLFKQLLMVAGLDRYYQVARCWRDEDLRADRQLEFTQLDVEASFVDQEDILGIIEEAVARGVEAVTGERPKPFPRLTWAEAMNRFGSDKPDTRFGMELCDLSALFAESGFNAFKGKGVVGLVVPGEGEMGRNKLDGLTDRAKSLGAAGLVWMRVREGNVPSTAQVKPASVFDAPVVKFLSEGEQDGLRRALSPAAGDLVLLVADPALRKAQSLLGTLRLDLGAPERLDGPLAFTWVVEFPLFEAISPAGPGGQAESRSRPTIRSPGPTPTISTSWSPSRWRCGAWPTTSSSTASSSDRARCVSTTGRSSRRSSPCWGSSPTSPPSASASCSKPSGTAPRPTPASPSASIG